MSTTAAENAALAKGSLVSRLAVLNGIPLWGWWLAAFALITVKAWLMATSGEPNIFNFYGEADDATRLVEVREFMNGAPWFDTTTYKLGGINGMLSHWSRLIDLPIAAIIGFFGLFLSANAAETVARTIWPLIVLAPLLWALLRTVTTAVGTEAGRIALLLAVLCPLGLYQFDIGRLDHHNVMIAATVSAVLMMWAYPASERHWLAAGTLSGFALTVGYEALAPVAAIAVSAALWGLVDWRQAKQSRAFTAALTASIAVGFVLTIPPSRWMHIHCDAISLNFVALSSIAGAGLVAALSLNEGTSHAKRFAFAAAAAAIGIAVYGRLEPKCLAGPMGQLPAELTPIWLDYVAETRSIAADLLHGRIEQSLGLIVYFGLAIAAQTRRFLSSKTAPEAFMLAATVSFALFACWQYKYMSYASFLAIAPLAWAVSRLKGSEEVSGPVLQVAVAVVLSQAAMLGASAKLQTMLDAPTVLEDGIRLGAEACETNDAIKDLSGLPPGLIAAHIDLGAYVAARTHHRILSAPYHRIPGAIIANHRIFAAHQPIEAAKLLAREKVDYVVTCKGLDDPFVNEPQWQGTLRAGLVAGNAPPYLERVALPDAASPFTVWRVKPETFNLRP